MIFQLPRPTPERGARSVCVTNVHLANCVKRFQGALAETFASKALRGFDNKPLLRKWKMFVPTF